MTERKPTIQIVLTFEVEGEFSWKTLRSAIQGGTEIVRGLKLTDIATLSVPDPFALPDPDDPPHFFK